MSDPERQVLKIQSIDCLAELAGYETAAKSRGILSEEIAAIHAKRTQLTPKKKRGRK